MGKWEKSVRGRRRGVGSTQQVRAIKWEETVSFFLTFRKRCKHEAPEVGGTHSAAWMEARHLRTLNDWVFRC